MHFNATVTGYFTLPHKLFTSTLPLGIYLGDFGSSLFFIVSGASLALTVPAEQNPAQFYKRRARAVYPLFWLAWFVVFSYRFVAHPGSFGGARTVTLVLTLLGLDNFAVAAGWVGTDFACVGEWFLGSILFLYLLFPLLQRGLRKRPWLTWALTLAVCIPVHLLGWDARLVAVHIPEFLFGMTFLTLAGRTRYILAPLLLAGAVLAQPWDGKITCALAGAGVFILRQAVAPTDLLPQLETDGGTIRVDRTMATNLPGVFAAGDCTGGPLQVAKAVGEGHVAALSACAWLEEQK